MGAETGEEGRAGRRGDKSRRESGEKIDDGEGKDAERAVRRWAGCGRKVAESRVRGI